MIKDCTSISSGLIITQFFNILQLIEIKLKKCSVFKSLCKFISASLSHISYLNMEPTHNFVSILIHYVANKSQKFHIRLFWFLIILMSFCSLWIYIPAAYTKFIGQPIIDVRIEENPVELVPFPAITICTGVFAKNEVVKFSDNAAELDEDNQKIFSISSQACDPSDVQHSPSCCGNKTDENVVDLLNQNTLDVEEVFAICSLNEVRLNCGSIFNKILTDRGFCYRINAQGYQTIFNSGVISDDFDSYKLTG
ncbi:hypothetical protein ACKWTF_015968 [Chironomus riparius]